MSVKEPGSTYRVKHAGQGSRDSRGTKADSATVRLDRTTAELIVGSHATGITVALPGPSDGPQETQEKWNHVTITHLKRALSSAKPSANASTAAALPIFRSANIARYRSNNGRSMSSSSSRSRDTVSTPVSAGCRAPASRPEVGGAGSMEVNVLDHMSRCPKHL